MRILAFTATEWALIIIPSIVSGIVAIVIAWRGDSNQQKDITNANDRSREAKTVAYEAKGQSDVNKGKIDTMAQMATPSTLVPHPEDSK